MYSSASAWKIPRKSTWLSKSLREDGSVRETLLPSASVQLFITLRYLQYVNGYKFQKKLGCRYFLCSVLQHNKINGAPNRCLFEIESIFLTQLLYTCHYINWRNKEVNVELSADNWCTVDVCFMTQIMKKIKNNHQRLHLYSLTRDWHLTWKVILSLFTYNLLCCSVFLNVERFKLPKATDWGLFLESY